MKNKKILLFAILALAIGFAIVSTTLYINGTIGYSTNKDDFNVIFTEAIPSEENKTSSKVNNKATAVIESDKKNITFSTQDLAVVGEWARVDYEITNYSRNYDANVTVSWELDDSTDTDFVNEYLEIENHENWTGNIEAGTSETGWVKVSVKKAYLGNGDVNDPKEINFTVTFDADAVSRESLGSAVNNSAWSVYNDQGTIGVLDMGDEVVIGTEHFYIFNTDDNKYKLISKYNLEVGNSTNSNFPAVEETYLQSPLALGQKDGVTSYATVAFGETSQYVGSNAEFYINKYAEKLTQMGATFLEARIFNESDFFNLPSDFDPAENSYASLGSFYALNYPEFMYNTSFWTSINDGSETLVLAIMSFGGWILNHPVSSQKNIDGIRPVIVVNQSDISL